MARPDVTTVAALSAAFLILLTVHSAAGPAPAADGGKSVIIAQYLRDGESGAQRRGTIRDLQKSEMDRLRPRAILGAGGGIEVREGFASVILSAPLGVQYDRYLVTMSPAFVFTNAQSLRAKKGWSLDNLVRTKISGRIYEFDLPFRFSYSFLDINAFPYSPYLSAGLGYSLRKFQLSGSSVLSRTNRDFTLNSLTFNIGFGFLVKITETTRMDVGLHIVTYFNTRSGIFNYDTAGASMNLGFRTFLN